MVRYLPIALMLGAFSTAPAVLASEHPRLFGNARQVLSLRTKFNEPRFARFKQLLLAEAERLLVYQGLHPQPGKDIGESYRAYKLAAQKKDATFNVLPWAYVLSGEQRYLDLFLKIIPHCWTRPFEPERFGSEFDLTKVGAPAAIAYDLLHGELNEEERAAYGSWLDTFLELRGKPSYGWKNNIGAIYFSGTGIVALARWDENPHARTVLAECFAKIKEEFYPHSIEPHSDSGYPEGPLYRSYALLWLLALTDAYENVTGDRDHGLLDAAFFRNSPNYVETLLGGDGVWVALNDSQPQLYGGPWCAYLGARYDQDVLRWFADYVMDALPDRGERGPRREVGPPYTTFTFLWRDPRPAPFPGLPTLSALPSLHTGCLRSDGSMKPALMVVVRGRGPVEHGHGQPDAGSFVFYAGGENILLDPGYYQPEAAKHSLLCVDGVIPQGKDACPVIPREQGDARSLMIDVTKAYSTSGHLKPRRVRRCFVLVGKEALVVLDDVAAAEGAPGSVEIRWQAAWKPVIQTDRSSAVLSGGQQEVWMKTFGPKLAMQAAGPHDFGKSWVYAALAEENRVAWYTVHGRYTVAATPLVTVFVPIQSATGSPRVRVHATEGRIEIQLPSNQMIRFAQADDGWQWQP